jgi:hypothetical protein
MLRPISSWPRVLRSVRRGPPGLQQGQEVVGVVFFDGQDVLKQSPRGPSPCHWMISLQGATAMRSATASLQVHDARRDAIGVSSLVGRVLENSVAAFDALMPRAMQYWCLYRRTQTSSIARSSLSGRSCGHDLPVGLGYRAVLDLCWRARARSVWLPLRNSSVRPLSLLWHAGEAVSRPCLDLDGLSVAEELVVLVVAAVASAHLGVVGDELDALDPFDLFEAELDLVAEP